MDKPAEVFTPALERAVLVRPEDRQVWADTFTGLYHVPPPDMPTPHRVLDVGANIGLTAAHYKKLWPFAQVVAVEMDGACCALIRENAPDVKVRRHAVHARTGYGSYDPRGKPEAYRFVPGGYGSQLEMVQALSLRQTILRAFDLGPVDFLKLDIEGAEWGVMERGEWEDLVTHLLVELHDDDDHPNDSDELVAEAIRLLAFLGFEARPYPPHPRAVYAQRP